MNRLTVHNLSNSPATRSERERALAILLSTMAFHDDADPADVIAAYHIALEGYPLEPIKRAVTRFIRGEVDGQSLSFIPKAPEFGREVSRLHTTMQPPPPRQAWTPEPTRQEPDADSKARVRAAVEALKRRLSPINTTETTRIKA